MSAPQSPLKEQAKAAATLDSSDRDRMDQAVTWLWQYWQEHGTGPTWKQFAEHVRPDYQYTTGRLYIEKLLFALRGRNLVTWTNRAEGSLRPGPVWYRTFPEYEPIPDPPKTGT